MILAKGTPPPDAPIGPHASPSDDAAIDEERVLACAACGAFVARARDRIEVEGAHEHSFVNPSAVAYRVACFKEAPGAAGVGEESTFWSWFKGHAWRIVVCARCAAHLGWSFRSTDRLFFGLIVDRLVER